ncbi:hypothetical protein PybrP1_011213 [[Pythium] brassicae (nom. inval.)]|nr:hypothetical protein PybrP1_011213 [[Pythium] brassicae (nom. inval.)]
MALTERDPFFESFWVMPELPTPQMKSEAFSALPPEMADARLTLKNRLKLLEMSREDELLKAIETSKQYCRFLHLDEFCPSPTASCHWKSCFTAEPTTMPLIFELPMVLFTRAILLFNQAKCVLSRGRDHERIATAATLYREAAGIFDYILELMNTNLMEGIEPPASMPDLSFDVLQSLQGVSLATAQQLSIVTVVLNVEKLYSKSVLVKLHSGCQASFQTFEAALVRNCGSSTPTPGSASLAAPSRHAKSLLAFARFFAKLHKAQTFLLTAELEHEARNFGRAIGSLAVARRLFQERSSMGGVGLSPLPSGCERLASLLSAKRSAIEQLLAAWTHENDVIYFDAIPGEEIVLATAMPQAFIMKPQPFDARRDVVVDASDGARASASTAKDAAGEAHECGERDGEHIQTIDEDSDEENASVSASESEVYLERVPIARTSATSTPLRVRLPVEAAPLSTPPKRESLVGAAHPDGELSVGPVAAPMRRQSERTPSLSAAQIATLAERASARKLSAGVAYKTEASKARAETLATQKRFKAIALAVAPAPLIQVEQPTKLTSEEAEQMRLQLAQGKPIFRLAKDTRWCKETLLVIDDELVFVRKKPLLFSTQKKVNWSAVQAVQLEQGDVKDTNFILIVAKKGDEMTPFEITASPPSDNRALFHCLQHIYQSKRKTCVQPRLLYPNFHAELAAEIHRQHRSFSRIQDVADSIGDDDDDDDSRSSESSSLNDDEEPELCTAPGAKKSSSLQELVVNARPRSRYARREHPGQSRRPLDRIATVSSTLLAPARSVPLFGSAASSPPREQLTRNRSASAVLGRHDSDSDRYPLGSPASQSLYSSLANQAAATPVPWHGDDLSRCFLTEVDAKSAESQRKLARCIARGSFALYGTCDFAAAVGHLSEALGLARGASDDGLCALLQHHIGVALKEDGQLKLAEAMQEKALQCAQRIGETRVRARALKALGVVAMDLHHLSRALDCQQEALALALALAEKDAELEARVYANLGNLAAVRVQLGHALSFHERDLRLSSLPHAESAVGQVRAHRNLALVYATLDKGELQRQHEQQAARWGSGARAFVHDMQTHPRDAIGNIYMQLTTRDVKLQDLVVESILDLVREYEQTRSSADCASADTVPVATPGVRPVVVKQVQTKRSCDGFSPSIRTRPVALGNSSSLKRLT